MNARAATEKQSNSINGDEEGGFCKYLKDLWKKFTSCLRRGRGARFTRFDVLTETDVRSRVYVMP